MKIKVKFFKNPNKIFVKTDFRTPQKQSVLFSLFKKCAKLKTMKNYTYKYRLYPNRVQAELMAQTFGCVRYVYNYMLDLCIKAYKETGEKPSQYDRGKILTFLKHDGEHEWLKTPPIAALQSANADLEKAYTNFFRRVKKGEKPGFPKFKSKRASRKSYRVYQVRVLNKKSIKLPKLGKVKARVPRFPQGRIISCTVSQTPSGKYFISVTTEVEKIPNVMNPAPKGSAVGIDLGIKDFATLSTGEKINPTYDLKRETKQLAKVQRKLAKKQKGSANRAKQRVKVAKVYEKIANQRKWFLQNLSTQILRENQTVVVETLKVQQMSHKGGNYKKALNRSIMNASWRAFIEMLRYKAEWYGRELVEVDRFYPSTQLCSCCGEKTGPKDLSVREWTCPNCLSLHDRDVNAAKNILSQGLVGVNRPEFTSAENTEPIAV